MPGCSAVVNGRRRGGFRFFLTGNQGPVLPDEQFEVLALLVGELQEDPLSLRVFKALTVLPEELVRGPLAADTNHQRLAVIDDAAQLISAGRKQPVGGALKKKKCRIGLELGVLGQQLLVAGFERIQVLGLFA